MAASVLRHCISFNSHAILFSKRTIRSSPSLGSCSLERPDLGCRWISLDPGCHVFLHSLIAKKRNRVKTFLSLENILCDSLLKPQTFPIFGLQAIVQSIKVIILELGLPIITFLHSSVQLLMLLVVFLLFFLPCAQYSPA